MVAVDVVAAGALAAIAAAPEALRNCLRSVRDILS
jgi:hypothetical protein